MSIARELSVSKTGKTHSFACTQDHFAIDPLGQEERRRRVGILVREANLEAYEKNEFKPLNMSVCV